MKTLKLHTGIYSLTAIHCAISAFSDLCEVHVVEDGMYFVCIFSDCMYDIDKTCREFENYLIDWMKTAHVNPVGHH